MKIFFLLLLFSLPALAQESRWIDIEWEEVAGAANYEVELFEGSDGKLTPRGKYKVENSTWSNAVPPGKYSLRIRSLDKRGVPGEWSDYIPVKVRMHNPKLFQPGPGSQVSTAQVDFEWSEVEGAAIYQLVVKNEKDTVVYNSTVKDIRATLFLEEIGQYSWSAYALEEGEAQRTQDDFTTANFKTFTRVGGELPAPEVKATVNEKITLEWQKIRAAKQYEIDYLPPVNADKSRRFKVLTHSFAFSPKRLRQGVTTITIRATAAGYPDSPKTVVQFLKSGDSVELQDIIQGGKEETHKVSPAALLWKDEVYASMNLAKYKYSSTDVGNDTELDQKELTGVGVNLEWMNKPKLNSLQRKTELSYLQMSSGRESGSKIRAAFSLNKEKNLGKGKLTYGGGVTYLRLPAFMGNRFENDIFVEQSSSLGPHLQLGYTTPVSAYWAWQTIAIYSQQLVYLDSERDGGKSYPWMSLNTRFLYFITKKEAIFTGVEYQSWGQKWSSDKSELAGFNLAIGLRAGF
jgi:hypothetical protein